MKKIFSTFIIICFYSLNIFSQSNLTGSHILERTNSLKNYSKKQKDFTFSSNFYLWALSLGGTTALPVNKPNINLTQTPELTVSLKFSDAVKNLKFAFMFGGKFLYRNFGLLYDLSYCNLKYDGTVPVSSGYLSGTIESKLFNGDFALLYKLPSKNSKVTVSGFTGARVTAMQNTIGLLYLDQSILSVDKNKAITDLIIGVDARFDFSEKWMGYLKCDAGGLGISSKFTSSFIGSLGYKFNKHWNSNIGFKYLYTNYDREYILWNVSQYGAILSFGYIMN